MDTIYPRRLLMGASGYTLTNRYGIKISATLRLTIRGRASVHCPSSLCNPRIQTTLNTKNIRFVLSLRE
eukprot:jgi/Picre1/33192/NNA_008517.t1